MSKLTFDMATWRHGVPLWSVFAWRVIFGDDDFTSALICSTFYQWYHRGKQQIGFPLMAHFLRVK